MRLYSPLQLLETLDVFAGYPTHQHMEVTLDMSDVVITWKEKGYIIQNKARRNKMINGRWRCHTRLYCQQTEHVLKFSMMVTSQVSHTKVFINIISYKFNKCPLAHPSPKNISVMFADLIHTLYDGIVADSDIDMV